MSQTKSRKIPTRNIFPLFLACRYNAWSAGPNSTQSQRQAQVKQQKNRAMQHSAAANKGADADADKDSTSAATMKMQPVEKSFEKYYSRIKVEAYDGPRLKDSASNKVGASNKKAEAQRKRNTDKSDRATTEQVLDPRTRMIIFKMLNRGIFNEIEGCISTGKEANVYVSV